MHWSCLDTRRRAAELKDETHAMYLRQIPLPCPDTATDGNMAAEIGDAGSRMRVPRHHAADSRLPEKKPQEAGRIPYFWLNDCGAAIPPIDDFRAACVFQTAFDGERAVGFRPAESRLTKKYGMHPSLEDAWMWEIEVDRHCLRR